MLGFFLEAETLILPDSVQKAQWKQIVERFTSLDAETFLRDFTGQVIWVALKIAVAFAIYAAGRWMVCLPLAQNLRTVLLHAQYCLLPHCYEVLPFTRHITSHG